MENKFTPGEWKYNDGENGKYFPHVSIPSHRSNGLPDENEHITINAGGWNMEVHQANAKLIAASPNMLEALEKAATILEIVINATETGTNRNLLTDANIWIQSAIQKATS